MNLRQNLNCEGNDIGDGTMDLEEVTFASLGDVGDAFFPHSVLKAALWFDYVATAEKELRCYC